MLNILLSLGAIFVLLVFSEYLYRKKNIRGEYARKLIHITVGSFVAFWPFYMSWRDIQLISVAFLIVVLISRGLKVFKAVHAVKRKTAGELLFPIAIGLCASLTLEPWVFAVAILHMSVADGFAAIIGKKFAKKYYKVFGEDRSHIGSLVFLVLSFLLTALFIGNTIVGLSVFALPYLFWYPIVFTYLENIGVRGVDNLLVPVAAIVLFGPLS